MCILYTKYIHKPNKIWHFFLKKSRWDSYDGLPFICLSFKPFSIVCQIQIQHVENKTFHFSITLVDFKALGSGH